MTQVMPSDSNVTKILKLLECIRPTGTQLFA